MGVICRGSAVWASAGAGLPFALARSAARGVGAEAAEPRGMEQQADGHQLVQLCHRARHGAARRASDGAALPPHAAWAARRGTSSVAALTAEPRGMERHADGHHLVQRCHRTRHGAARRGTPWVQLGLRTRHGAARRGTSSVAALPSARASMALGRPSQRRAMRGVGSGTAEPRGREQHADGSHQVLVRFPAGARRAPEWRCRGKHDWCSSGAAAGNQRGRPHLASMRAWLNVPLVAGQMFGQLGEAAEYPVGWGN